MRSPEPPCEEGEPRVVVAGTPTLDTSTYRRFTTTAERSVFSQLRKSHTQLSAKS